jgi:hypothetical protein
MKKLTLAEAKIIYLGLKPYMEKSGLKPKQWTQVENKQELGVFTFPAPDHCGICGLPRIEGDFWSNLWLSRTREVHTDFILIFDHDPVCERCKYRGQLYDFYNNGILHQKAVESAMMQRGTKTHMEVEIIKAS